MAYLGTSASSYYPSRSSYRPSRSRSRSPGFKGRDVWLGDSGYNGSSYRPRYDDNDDDRVRYRDTYIPKYSKLNSYQRSRSRSRSRSPNSHYRSSRSTPLFIEEPKTVFDIATKNNWHNGSLPEKYHSLYRPPSREHYCIPILNGAKTREEFDNRVKVKSEPPLTPLLQPLPPLSLPLPLPKSSPAKTSHRSPSRSLSPSPIPSEMAFIEEQDQEEGLSAPLVASSTLVGGDFDEDGEIVDEGVLVPLPAPLPPTPQMFDALHGRNNA